MVWEKNPNLRHDVYQHTAGEIQPHILGQHTEPLPTRVRGSVYVQTECILCPYFGEICIEEGAGSYRTLELNMQ
jgi:hypothetical protein